METSESVLSTADILVAGSAEWSDPLLAALETSGASVRAGTTIDETLAAIEDRQVDCVVTAGELADGTALDLLERARERTTTLPVILCTNAGSERLASDAIGAGATDYVSLGPAPNDFDHVLDRIAAAIRDAQRTRTRLERVRQFEAVFQDTQTATWVLDPDGNLERANKAAREMVDGDIGTMTGRPFWRLPWWTQPSESRSEIRRMVRKTIDGESTERVVTNPEDAETTMLELTFLPVHDPRGDLVAVVVEAEDITDQVSVYRDLRESEELHRVTLNNMTDTVLITDDSGAFTYICPNVHFIFGYSVEEIREFETIDHLLGDDLYDEDELAAEGVLTNIECTATDKHGTEHTLLVNVREVDIQDGDVLFSCRDITKRKQREEALTTLHGTTQRLQYAETKEEIAGTLAEDATDLLDLPAVAFWLYRTDENTLRPVAYSDRMQDLHGPLDAVPATKDSLVGYSFVNDYPRYYDDIRESDRLANPATGLRSAAVVPVGEHGLIFLGSPESGKFDRVRRELTDLIAATASAALDRVERDSRLRSKDRKLQRQNRELEQLNRLNELIREIDRAIVQAETRDEIEKTVCEALTSSGNISFAWIGEIDSATDRIEPQAWAGDGGGYLDSLTPIPIAPDSEPAGQTGLTRDVSIVSNVADEIRHDDWQTEALSRGFQSAISVPLAYDDFMYGTLTVYADTAETFDGRAQETLRELGETIASAISALNRTNALLTSSGTRLEFRTRDPGFTLLQLARRANCSITFEGGIQQTDDGVALFVTVDPADVDSVVTEAEEMLSVSDVQMLSRGESRGLLRLELAQSFLGLSLADHGAVLRQVTATESGADIIVDVPSNNDSQPIIQHVLESLEETELTAKHTEDRTPTHELYSTFLDRVTDRQLEVVETAYYSGFFESPRERTGEEVAESLGISGPAFYDHTRTVQRKLFRTLFDEIGVPATVPRGG